MLEVSRVERNTPLFLPPLLRARENEIEWENPLNDTPANQVTTKKLFPSLRLSFSLAWFSRVSCCARSPREPYKQKAHSPSHPPTVKILARGPAMIMLAFAHTRRRPQRPRWLVRWCKRVTTGISSPPEKGKQNDTKNEKQQHISLLGAMRGTHCGTFGL